MNREQLLSKFKPKIETVEFEGDTYHVRSLRVSNLLGLVGHQNDADQKQMVLVLTQSLCDAEGTRLLGDADTEAVENMPAELFGSLSRAVLQVNGLSDDAHQELAKN